MPPTELGKKIPLQSLCGVLITSAKDYYSKPENVKEYEKEKEKK